MGRIVFYLAKTRFNGFHFSGHCRSAVRATSVRCSTLDLDEIWQKHVNYIGLHSEQISLESNLPFQNGIQ